LLGRHGAETQAQGKSAQYAYIDIQIPVRISHIFRVEETRSNGSKLFADVAIIQQFKVNTVIQDFPWDLW
jgi:hypothetical protein